LFPYGVGCFKDNVRLNKALGFRNINMKPHVSHLLSLTDTRFQKHLSFIFVMMNILQWKTSSFQSRLAFKRSWFPQVSKAFSRVTKEALSSLQSKLKKNSFIVPENEAEQASQDLLKYINYMSDHISGSTAEINACMKKFVLLFDQEVCHTSSLQ